MGAITTPCVTLDQLVSDCLHNVAILAHDITEGVSDVGIGSALVMHGEAEVHGTVQVGRGFGLAQSGAGDGEIVHATIISTGSDGFRAMVDSASVGTISLCFQSLKWCKIINNLNLTSELRCNNLACRFQLFCFSLLSN